MDKRLDLIDHVKAVQEGFLGGVILLLVGLLGVGCGVGDEGEFCWVLWGIVNLLEMQYLNSMLHFLLV